MYSLQIVLIVLAAVLSVFAVLLLFFGCSEYKLMRDISKEMLHLSKAVAARYELIPKLIEELEIIDSGNSLIYRIRKNYDNALSSGARDEILKFNQLLTIAFNELEFIADYVSNDLLNDDFNKLRAQISACNNRIYLHKQKINELILVHSYRRKNIFFKSLARALNWKDTKALVILPDEIR